MCQLTSARLVYYTICLFIHTLVYGPLHLIYFDADVFCCKNTLERCTTIFVRTCVQDALLVQCTVTLSVPENTLLQGMNSSLESGIAIRYTCLHIHHLVAALRILASSKMCEFIPKW